MGETKSGGKTGESSENFRYVAKIRYVAKLLDIAKISL